MGKRFLAMLLTAAMLVMVCVPSFAADAADGCSAQYAGWYRVKTGGVEVSGRHTLAGMAVETLPEGARVWVSLASGTGSGAVGHVGCMGQECYLPMEQLEPVHGVTGRLTNLTAGAGYLEADGYAFDWDDTDRSMTVELAVDGRTFRYEAKAYAGEPVTECEVKLDDEGRLFYHGFASGMILLSAGEHTVELYALCEDGSRVLLDEGKVEVLPRRVRRIRIVQKPAKTAYLLDETLDTTGLVLEALYTTDEVETVTTGFTCSPKALSIAGTRTITVTYGEAETSFTVTVAEPEETPETPAEPDPPAEPEQPEQPAQPQVPASGGGGMMIVLGGAALAAGGAALLLRTALPCRYSGHLYRPDGTAVPGAVLTLQQDGQVVARTRTAADGSFSFAQLRRGEYDLVLEAEDAACTLARVKAPCRNAEHIV